MSAGITDGAASDACKAGERAAATTTLTVVPPLSPGRLFRQAADIEVRTNNEPTPLAIASVEQRSQWAASRARGSFPTKALALAKR